MATLVLIIVIALLVWHSRRSDRNAIQNNQQKQAQLDASFANSLREYYASLQSKHEREVIEKFAYKYGIYLPDTAESANQSQPEQSSVATDADPWDAVIPSRGKHSSGSSALSAPAAHAPYPTQVSAPAPAHSASAPIDSTNYLLFFGALLIVVALLYFSRTTYEMFGSTFRFSALVGITGIFYGAGAYLYKNYKKLRPAGITFMVIAVCGGFVLGGSLYQDILQQRYAAAAWLFSSSLSAALLWHMHAMLKSEAVQYAGFIAGLSSVLALQSTFGLPTWLLPLGSIVYSCFLLWCSRSYKITERSASELSNSLVPVSVVLAALIAQAQGQPVWVIGFSMLTGAAYYMLFARYARRPSSKEAAQLTSFALLVIGVSLIASVGGNLRNGLPMAVGIIGGWCGLLWHSNLLTAKKLSATTPLWAYVSYGLTAYGIILSPSLVLATAALAITTLLLCGLYSRTRDNNALGALGIAGIVGVLTGLQVADLFIPEYIGLALAAISILWIACLPLVHDTEGRHIVKLYGVSWIAIGLLFALGDSMGWYGVAAALWAVAAFYANSIHADHRIVSLATIALYISAVCIALGFSPELAVLPLYAGLLVCGYAIWWSAKKVTASDFDRQLAAGLAVATGCAQFLVDGQKMPIAAVLGWLLIAVGLAGIWRSSNRVHVQYSEVTVRVLLAGMSAVSVIASGYWASRSLEQTSLQIGAALFVTTISCFVWLAGMAHFLAQPDSDVPMPQRFSSAWRYVAITILTILAFTQATISGEDKIIWALLAALSGLLVITEGHISDSAAARYGGSAVTLVGSLLAVQAFGITSVHVYAHMVAVYFLGLAWIVSVYRHDKERAELLTVLGLLSAFIPLAVQALDGDTTKSLVLLIETAVALCIGAILQNKAVMLTAGITLAISVTYRLSAYVANIPTWVWYFGFGAGFIALAVWLINRQDKPRS